MLEEVFRVENKACPPVQDEFKSFKVDYISNWSHMSGLVPTTCQFFNFSNQTIIKEDIAILAKQGQYPILKWVRVGTIMGTIMLVRMGNIQKKQSNRGQILAIFQH